MRVKLYQHKIIQHFLYYYITTPQVNIWNLNFFVFKKSKSKEQIQDILKYSNESVYFKRKPINSKKYGPDQQSIYSPFEEFYDVEMEDKDLIRMVFEVPKE